MFEIPIVYVNDISDPYALAISTVTITLNMITVRAIYSGVYFREFGKNGRIIKARSRTSSKRYGKVIIISEPSY